MQLSNHWVGQAGPASKAEKPQHKMVEMWCVKVGDHGDAYLFFEFDAAAKFIQSLYDFECELTKEETFWCSLDGNQWAGPFKNLHDAHETVERLYTIDPQTGEKLEHLKWALPYWYDEADL